MHIDSCDFSLEEYQAVADPIADPDFATFTIDRDKKYMIPMLKDAMAMTAQPFSVLVALNKGASSASYAIRLNGHVIRVEFPAKTISTVLI
ncbi:MAG: hypothetical protein EGR77_08040 [Pseudobutyrivibrio sp.]|nr:hypothetical protein [Pseudobutyrivibrio sp.]